MSKVISFQFPAGTDSYTSDAGLNLSINSRFVAPPDIDDDTAVSIVTAAGGIITENRAICSDSSIGTPRKLEFIRASGNLMTLAFSNIDNVIDVASDVKAILDESAGANNQVVCIKLHGEKFLNLNDELGLTFDGTSFAQTHIAPVGALKQNFASGVITYNAHALATPGGAVLHRIKSITEKATNEFAAQLGDTATSCIGNFLNVQNCGNGKRNPREHRRYTLSLATKGTPDNADEVAQNETIELPVASAAATEILSCGQTAASLPGVFCIGYEGESYSKIHRLIN